MIALVRRFLLSLLCLLLLSCSSTQQEVIIGVLYQAGSSSGNSLKRTAEMMQQHVNKAGGLEIKDATYQLRIVYRDSGPTAETAVTAVKALLAEHDMMALIGPNNSTQAIPVANEAETSKVYEMFDILRRCTMSLPFWF